MVLVRRTPYRSHLTLERQLRDMQRVMDSLFGGQQQQAATQVWRPSCDMYQDGDDLVVEMELPGVDVDNDVDVDIEDDVLSIRGRRSSSQEQRGEQSFVVERRSGSFERSIALPEGVDPEAITADYRSGVLTVRVPLPTQQQPSRRQIGIRRTEDEEGGDKAITTTATASGGPGKPANADEEEPTPAGKAPTIKKAAAKKKAGAKKSTAKKKG